MKRLQHVTTFSLIIALTGLSPMAAADSGKTSYDVARVQQINGASRAPLVSLSGMVETPRLQAKKISAMCERIYGLHPVCKVRSDDGL